MSLSKTLSATAAIAGFATGNGNEKCRGLSNGAGRKAVGWARRPQGGSRRRLAALAIAAILLPLVPGTATAIPIAITDPAKQFVDVIDICTGGGKTFKHCKSTAFISTTSLAGNDAEFKKSFDAWNLTNAADAKWTLANGGALPGGKFDVALFQAQAETAVGGLDIRVFWNDYSGTDRSEFYWAQGLYDNYLLSGAIVPPFYEMDVDASKTYKPPLYPYQYDDRHFFDGPRAPWPNSFFIAEVFLSKADATARTLTIYEGIRYGFRLSVPEPSAIVLLLFGFVALLFVRKLHESVERSTRC